MTEQPTSFERPQPGVDPAESRGALLRTQQQPQKPSAQLGDPALPVQARPDGTPSGAGTATPCDKGREPAVGQGKEPSVNGPEHAQPAGTEPDAHRPRPAPEAIPAQPGAEQERSPGGQERR
ncbi:serine/threonine protein phosphatase, partial [Streptomyces olivaceoviridis]